MSKVTIEIDGKTLQAPQGAMIIEVADEAGISIPRFCYHKKLSVAANCRMCLVEVEKAPKALPACATPVVDGMKVLTASAAAKEAQKSVMEFLLINHPLDCPICDQGGECELQDVAMGYGGDVSRFTEGKRVVQDKDIGPLIQTDMTRCIHCTRCVRFGAEVAGLRELGATGRGEHTEIGTFLEKSIDSELSGNAIDLCPVGALTSKPFRFSARSWEMQQVPGVAAHDCVGSNTFAHVRRDEVMRVVPRENEQINEVWLSDRDRFSYLGLRHKDRLASPKIKVDGQWQDASWEDAFDAVKSRLDKVLTAHGPSQFASLLSSSSTVEEGYLLQKLMRELGSNNIDFRLRQLDFSQPQQTAEDMTLGMSVSELEHLDTVVMVGSYTRKEQPIIAHRLRKLALKGGKVCFINAQHHDNNFDVCQYLTAKQGALDVAIAGVTKALAGLVSQPLDEVFNDINPTEEQTKLAGLLHSGQQAAIVLGLQVWQHPNSAFIRHAAKLIGKMANAQVGHLTEGANALGLWSAGAVPFKGPAAQTLDKQDGRNINEMIDNGLKAVILHQVSPGLDAARPGPLLKALQKAECVVALTSYVSQELEQIADVLLPVATNAESSGTFANAEGTWQSFSGLTKPFGESRPGWKVIRVLANWLEREGFDYKSSSEILDELKTQLEHNAATQTLSHAKATYTLPSSQTGSQAELQRLASWPIYAVDDVVRRSSALQDSVDAIDACVLLSEVTANKLGIKPGDDVVAAQSTDYSTTLSVAIDDDIPEGCAYIPAGVKGTETLRAISGTIELTKVA